MFIIKKIVLSVGIVSLFFGVFSQEVFAVEKAGTKEKVIVVFKDKSVANKTLVINNNGDVDKVYKNIPAVSAEMSEVAINNLEKNPNVLSVEYDKKVYLVDKVKNTQVNSVEIKTQKEDWGINSTNAKTAWNKGIEGNGVKVAVLDTGIEYYHEDLDVVGGVSFVTEYFNDGTADESYDDYHGHGTHVAGTIGAKNNSIGTVGIAPNSDIYAVKIMDASGSGDLSDVIAGVDWAITNKMDIVNLSIGSPSGSSAYQEIFKKAKQAGVIVFAASGNDNEEDSSGVDYPAFYPETVAVAAIDSNLNHASFSSVGPRVDLAAPGVNILSTYIGGDYGYMSGTSMATPYSAGMAALYKETYPNLSSIDLINKMFTNTKDLGVAGKDNQTGRGLIQYPKEESVIEFNKIITTYATYNLYTEPNDLTKTSMVVAPQKLQAYLKQGDFIQINTWTGKLYIKPTLYLEGEKKVTTKKVTLTQTTGLYDLPFESHKRKEVLGPQMVYTIEELNNGWYVVQTWLGYKYIKPVNPIVENYVEKVRLSYREELLTAPDLNHKTGATVSPQTVTTLDKRGDYYLINTWLGSRWIKPKNPIVGDIVPTTEKITLTARKDLHELPFDNMKTGAGISSGQTVQAIEKWGNWVLIKTYLGNKWIKL